MIHQPNIPATISLTDAAGPCWDVAIVGAGPAGALAAALLARRGQRVLLIDKAEFPRAKVCGCCLNARALAILERAQLIDQVWSAGATPLTTAGLFSGGIHASLTLPAGAVLSRRMFDATLINAAIAQGAHFLPRTAASFEPPDRQPNRKLTLRRQDECSIIRATLVLACDGLAGRLLDDEPASTWHVSPHSRLGAAAVIATSSPDYPAGIVHMAVGRGAYVGLVRLEDATLDVASAMDPAACKQAGGPAHLIDAVVCDAGLPPVPEILTTRFEGTPLLTRRRPRLGSHRAFAAGDACGYVEPFTGEGMAWALEAAWEVVPFVEAGLTDWSDDLTDRWTRYHNQTIGRRRLLCRALTRLLRYPSLARATVRIAQASPYLGGFMIQHINRTRGQTAHLSPIEGGIA